jgi:hypothetical protein
MLHRIGDGIAVRTVGEPEYVMARQLDHNSIRIPLKVLLERLHMHDRIERS